MELQGFIIEFLDKISHNEMEGGREFLEKSSSFLPKKRNGLSEDRQSIISSDFNEWLSTGQLTHLVTVLLSQMYGKLSLPSSPRVKVTFQKPCSIFTFVWIWLRWVCVHSIDLFPSGERMVSSPPPCSDNLWYCWAQWAQWAESLVGKAFWMYSSLQFLLSQLPPSVLKIPEVPEKTH